MGGWVGWVGWGGVGGVSGYDQLCCPASPKLLLGLDLGLRCDNRQIIQQVTDFYMKHTPSPV